MLILMDSTKQIDNLGGFKSNYLFNVWGEGSLAKSEGSLAAPFIYSNINYSLIWNAIKPHRAHSVPEGILYTYKEGTG